MRKILINIFLAYLRACGKLQLKKNNPYIIGISGSAGKTSTMDALYAILRDYKKTKFSLKANSETGIPLDILGIKVENFTVLEWIKIFFLIPYKLLTNWEKYEVYVVEMGVDSIEEPKNMKYLLKILVPNIAIYLNVNAVHGVNYESSNGSILNPSQLLTNKENKNEYLEQVKDLIANDKNLLVKAIDRSGMVVLNMEDTRVAKSKELAVAPVYEIRKISEEELMMKAKDENVEKLLKRDIHEGTTLYYSDGKNEGGFSFNFLHNSKLYKVQFPTLILPKHFSVTFSAALGVAYFLKIDLESAIESLIENYKLEPGRSSVFKGVCDSTIIDSSYNSSKEATKDMIDLLNEYKFNQSNGSTKTPYKIAVLGDMRELGSNSRIEHEDLAEYTFNKVDEYFLVGKEMKNFFIPKLINLGINKYKIHYFDKAGDCGKSLEEFLHMHFNPEMDTKNIDDFYSKYIDREKFQQNYSPLILVKGSQNTIFLELVVEQILQNKEDTKLLCRRGKFWNSKRKPYTI